MSDENSRINLESGGDKVEIEGSEEFISNQMEQLKEIHPSLFERDSTNTQENQQTIREEDESETSSEETSADNRLQQIAQELDLPYEKLNEEFHLEENKVHIQNPRSIPPKIALLGYCAIKSEIDENHFENKETKEILENRERVNLDDWKNILYNGRDSGIIKDVGDQKQYKPFKIMPKGLDKLSDWLDENSK